MDSDISSWCTQDKDRDRLPRCHLPQPSKAPPRWLCGCLSLSLWEGDGSWPVIYLERRARLYTVVDAVCLTFPLLSEKLQARTACLRPIEMIREWGSATGNRNNAPSLSVSPMLYWMGVVWRWGRLLAFPPALWPVPFLIFREKFFPCERVLSVSERICKIAPGEERLFHPVLKPSQRDKFCCFCFVCEFFSTQLYSLPETMGPVLASKE